MKVFTCVGFSGRWSGIPTAAVVVADTPGAAARLLLRKMESAGLKDEDGFVSESTMQELDVSREGAVILADGDR